MAVTRSRWCARGRQPVGSCASTDGSPGTPEAAVQGTPPRAPLIRSLFYAVLGLLAAVWALATLVSG
jgi:hypothetical protein